jgi:hypothetical protein
MAFREKGNEGKTNGTTAVTMVAAPRKEGVKRIIKNWAVYNADDAGIDYFVQVDKAATDYVIYRSAVATLVDDQVSHIVVLDADDEKLEIVLAGAKSTVDAHWTVAYAEIDTTE